MKKAKMILPLLAFVFAVAGSLANAKTTAVANEVSRSSTSCVDVGSCDELNANTCTDNGTIYKIQSGTCPVAATGNFN